MPSKRPVIAMRCGSASAFALGFDCWHGFRAVTMVPRGKRQIKATFVAMALVMFAAALTWVIARKPGSWRPLPPKLSPEEVNLGTAALHSSSRRPDQDFDAIASMPTSHDDLAGPPQAVRRFQIKRCVGKE
jgi:hypothetical protein